METPSEKKQAGNFDLIDSGRVMNFSDAIFAFAATLLVLKIDVPVLNSVALGQELPTAIVNLWPQYLANIITFFVIGHYWLEHHAIFAYIKHYNRMIVWLNILLLISVAFLPFPVDLYGDHSEIPFVVAFYSASLALVGLLNYVIWIYASNGHKLIDKKVSERTIKYYNIKYAISPVVFALAIPISFVDPLLAQFSWVFVILGIVLFARLNKNKQIDNPDNLIIT